MRGALKKRIEELVDERLTADKVPIGRQLRVKLLGDIIDEMVGFGPLEQLLKDDTITEIMVNGHPDDLHRAKRPAESFPDQISRCGELSPRHRQDSLAARAPR